MNRNALLVVGIIIALSLTGLIILEYSQGAVTGLVFDQYSYNYTSKVWIPPQNTSASATSAAGSSLGGYYHVEGKGRDFTMHMVISGAEKTESPLDYTAEGLWATGHLYDIHVTWDTIQYLLNREYQEVVLNTRFQGYMNMTCAAWNGTTHFQNNLTDFTGSFNITGTMTDWEGTYQILEENGRMILIGDYIYYPHGQPNSPKLKRVQKSFYIS
jgi:hypothetical protein